MLRTRSGGNASGLLIARGKTHVLSVTFRMTCVYGPLFNHLLARCTHSADVDDPYKLTDEKRQLGLIVCRGTAVTLVCPCDGMMEIANPFLQE